MEERGKGGNFWLRTTDLQLINQLGVLGFNVNRQLI